MKLPIIFFIFTIITAFSIESAEAEADIVDANSQVLEGGDMMRITTHVFWENLPKDDLKKYKFGYAIAFDNPTPQYVWIWDCSSKEQTASDCVRSQGPHSNYDERTIRNGNMYCLKGIWSINGSVSVQPNRPCTPPPDPDVNCSLTTSAITLDFGEVKSNQMTNYQATGNVNITCTGGKTKVRLRLKDNNYIPLNNGLNVTIDRNGQTLDVSKGDNNIQLTGALSGTPKSYGPFTGNGVLLLELP